MRFSDMDGTGRKGFGVCTAALWVFLHFFVLISISGCGDFFAQKPTEIESRAILKDIAQVKESPHIRNTLPQIYCDPPRRVRAQGGVKLFYFTKHHGVKELGALVTAQLGNKISQMPATNQLIIHCVDDADADKVLEVLEGADIAPIQINIDCIILERFADVTMDWETSILIENFLGQKLTLGANRGTFGDGTAGKPLGSLLDLEAAFPGASLREGLRSTFGLDFGYWGNRGVAGHQFRAVVDMLESRGYLKILLNPTLEVINGKTANVMIRDWAPIEKTVTGNFDQPYNITEYVWVEDSLTVTPYVYADGSIGLKTEINIGSRSKPEGVVQTSIITERSIEVQENRIEPGKSLVIGGMRKSEKRSVIRGIPFFKDLPIIGVLFSSKDFEEKATEITFILTPSISSGGGDHASAVEGIRKRHSPIQYDTGIGELLTDPLGTGIYTEHVEREALDAETEKIRAEADTKDALRKAARAETDKLLAESDAEEAHKAKSLAQTEVEKAKAEVEKVKADSQKLIDAEKAKAAAAETAKVEAVAGAEKTKADALKLLEVEKAKVVDAEAKTVEAEKAKTKAEAETAVAEKAKTDAEAETVEAQKAEAEAAAALEKAKTDAEKQGDAPVEGAGP